MLAFFPTTSFGKSWLEHAALDDFGISADGQDVGGNAANLNVGIGAGALKREGRDDDDLGGDEGLPSVPRATPGASCRILT